MGTFSDRMTTTATRLITKYGESVAIQRVVEGAYDPADGSVTSGTTTNYTVFGVPGEYKNSEIDGEIIRVDDINLTVQKHASVTPAVGDVATINSKAYRVMAVNKVRVQGADIIYRLQLRS